MSNPLLPLLAVVLSAIALVAGWQANQRMGVVLSAVAATRVAALPDARESKACFDFATGLDDPTHKALFAGQRFAAPGKAQEYLARCDPRLGRKRGDLSALEAGELSKRIRQHLGSYEEIARLFATAGLRPSSEFCTVFGEPAREAAKSAAKFLRDAIRRNHDGASADDVTRSYANILALEPEIKTKPDTKPWCGA